MSVTTLETDLCAGRDHVSSRRQEGIYYKSINHLTQITLHCSQALRWMPNERENELMDGWIGSQAPSFFSFP